MKKWQKRMILVAGASLLAYAAHENYRKQQEQKEPRPESLTGTALLHGLVAHADEEITVKQAVDRFEEMSRLPVDHPSPVDPETPKGPGRLKTGIKMPLARIVCAPP